MPEHKISGFDDLTEREWDCFRHLAGGGALEDLAEALVLKTSYMTKIMYQMLKKLGINNYANIFPMAKAWGFIE